MFGNVTAESVGVRTAQIEKFYRALERAGLNTHSVLMMRGEQIFAETYWAPFTADFAHRMYSQTKSFVGVAIGLLTEEGKIDLDAPLVSFFPDKADEATDVRLRAQTIRQTLCMCTTHPAGYWFTDDPIDRARLYFHGEVHHEAGTIWYYDSQGSQMLSQIAERVSGMRLLDYLRKKIFSHTGGFETAHILSCGTEGDSWGDSALLCTPRDMLLFARFVMNYGMWHGKRLMRQDYLRAATTPQTDNWDGDSEDSYAARGYGYQIWCDREDAFFFNGMGDQFTYCVPKKDFIFCINSDNQGMPGARQLIYSLLHTLILDEMADTPLPPDPTAEASLRAYSAQLRLRACSGMPDTATAKRIGGKVFAADGHNRQGITKFSLHFHGDVGELHYTNAQGDKVLPFGICKNVFTKFPEYGYDNEVGAHVTTDGFLYRCAAAGAWRDNEKFMIRVRVIDRYFGNLTMLFAFRDNIATVNMVKTAENFFQTYEGEFTAHMAD